VLTSDGLTEGGGRHADELAERRLGERLLTLRDQPAQRIADDRSFVLAVEIEGGRQKIPVRPSRESAR